MFALRMAFRRFLCRRGLHDWQFVGDGILAEFMGFMMASGDQKCARCDRQRKKSWVVGEARRK